MSRWDGGRAVDGSAVALELLAGSAARVTRLVLHPPLLPTPLHPAVVVDRLARRGSGWRAALSNAVGQRLDVLVPAVLSEVLSRARLTQLVTQYVDLDEVVASMDLDAAVKRLDLDAAVARVDLDAVVGHLDFVAVLDRLDLIGIALERVALERIITAALQRVDPADLVGLAEQTIEAIDLTKIVLDRVDLERIITAVLQRVDPADLVGLVEQIIDAIDLPEIIRGSTGSMASDTVRGARMQGIAADEAVARGIDRLLHRRGRPTANPHEPLSGPPPSSAPRP